MAAMMENQFPQQDDLPSGHDTLMGLPELEAEFNAYSSTSATMSTSFTNTITVASPRNYRSELVPSKGIIDAKSVFGNITQYVLCHHCDLCLI